MESKISSLQYIMILPYRHRPSVQSVAGNGQGCMRTMQG